MARGPVMRARASLGLRIAAVVAFGATAALAVTLNRAAPMHAALTSQKGHGAPHSAPATRSTAGAPRCGLPGLRISVGAGSRVTAAVNRYPLDFTNVGATPCTLTGYPEVAAYQGDGTEIGDASVRDTSVAAAPVPLAPGQTAHTYLDAFLSPRCRPVLVTGLRVVPPGQSAGRDVKRSLTACAARRPADEGYLRVRAVQPGSGTGGGAAVP